MISIKEIQSEFGVTGDCSPNYKLIEETRDRFKKEFEHIHGTLTDEDCVLFISNFCIGKKYKKDERFCINGFFNVGCSEDIENALVTYLKMDPEMINTFQRALIRAIYNV